ncbi:beta strand repeat-containing protein, partial [Hyunsoonleella ulvae]|uniref:beta strand repeat-containing protein n=1 Tax=Hyunsoonleella ulvae TaxID=2799948 RepID=UPI00193AD2D0
MKKLYNTKTEMKIRSKHLMIFVLLLSFCSIYAQVRVPFTPRTSSATPTQTSYTVKGDFSMIGNTNLTLAVYGDGTGNNNDMQYVDVDSDPTTMNSSSATLTFSTENGAIPECSNIVYAGLYWSGRAFGDGETDSQTFTVTKGGLTTTFDKQKVKLRGPGASGYTEFNANGEIAFPTNGDDRNMYSAYAEITSYVQQFGLGEYFVADVATREGATDGTGYYGGWGMVVVYENSKMKYRDITVFDGHAYVVSGIASHEIPISGFNATQNGDVNLKIGLMAGEGDVPWTGDYFEMLRQDTNTFERLSHSGNTTGNFFNSSIVTAGTRNPSILNNTGLDIVMFDIDNGNNNANPTDDNKFIDNNQTSTTLRYGTTLDTYIIFNVTFAVDAYVPEPEGLLTNTSINGNPPGPTNDSLEPGEDAIFDIEIRNTGTEAIDNTILTIPVPPSIDPSNFSIVFNTYPPFSTPNVPTYDSSIGPNGSIVWNLGTLPIPSDPDFVLADISFSLTVTRDCAILADNSFDPTVTLNGTMSGTGAISNISFVADLIQGYETDGPCIGEPIPIPAVIDIDYIDYINEPPTASNPSPVNIQCISDLPSPDVNVVTDEADNSGLTPVVAFVSDASDNGSNPEVITRTYSVTDDCGNSINVLQTITINDTTDPTISCSSNVTANTSEDGIGNCSTIVNLGSPTTSDNCSVASVVAQVNGSDIDPATFEFGTGDTTVTWIVTDDSGNTANCNQTVTITDDEDPTISCPASINVDVDAGTDGAIVTYTAPTGTDNCPNPSTTQIAGLPSGSLFPVGTTTNTFEVTDAAGNTATCSFDVTVTDNEDPTITCPTPINVNVDGGTDGAVVTYTAPVGTDNNASGTVTTTQIAGLPSGSLFPVGTTTNTFEVTDAAGNTATCSFDVTVTDNEDPTITCPAPINVNVDGGTDGAVVTYTAPVGTDNNASGTVTTTQIAGLPSGSLFPVGTTTNTFEVTDAAGNTATCSFDVTVTDNEDPTINCPAPINVNVDGGTDGAVVTYTAPVGTDNNASGTVTTTQIAGLPSGSLFPVGTTTNTFEVTDAAGNTATCSFDVTVTDNEDPTINCPAPINVNVDGGTDGAVVTYTAPVGTDNNASGTVTTTQIAGLPSGSLFPVGTTTNTFEVTDAAGNTATCSFDVTVTDNEDPTITCPTPINVNVDGGTDGAVVTYTAPVGTDNNASGTVTTTQIAGLPSGSLFPVGTTTNTFEVTDAAGNTATCSFDVTVTDNEDPTITCPAPINVNVDGGTDGAVVTYTAPVGTDNNASGTVTTTQIAGLPSGSLFPVGTTTNTFEVTDAAGNTATCSFDVTVTDNE